MTDLATSFRAILTGLRAAIAAHAVRDRVHEAVLVLVWGRIGRMANRFDALFARWRAGTLPKPRPSRAGKKRAPAPLSSPPPAAHPRLPRRRAWVVGIVGWQSAGFASQLQHRLDQPDLAPFLAAVPQAGRILRPLCHMLGIAQPPPLQLPPRPPRVRPPRPRSTRPRAEPTRPLSARRLRALIGRPRLPPVLFPARPGKGT